ncbi:hypothetical protein ACLOJK_038158 [Asimina triloba]
MKTIGSCGIKIEEGSRDREMNRESVSRDRETNRESVSKDREINRESRLEERNEATTNRDITTLYREKETEMTTREREGQGDNSCNNEELTETMIDECVAGDEKSTSSRLIKTFDSEDG